MKVTLNGTISTIVADLVPPRLINKSAVVDTSYLKIHTSSIISGVFMAQCKWLLVWHVTTHLLRISFTLFHLSKNELFAT